MPINLRRLAVEAVAIHEVPKRAPGGSAILTTSECEMDDPMRAYFAERLRTSLTRAVDVVLDPDTPSVVPGIIRGYLDETLELLPASQQLAGALYSAQSGVNNPGLLALTRLNIDGRRAVGVLKLQKEMGMRGELVERDQARIYDVDLIHNIFFTDETRVFKAGVFQASGQRIEGLVSDQQAASPSEEVATFFLSGFLGCRYAVSSDRATQALFLASERFVNEGISDPVEKTRFEQALISELASEHQMVDAHLLAEGHLRPGLRQGYLAYLTTQGVPVTAIRKDPQLIRNQLVRIQYKFRGATVLVEPSRIDDGTVTLEAVEERKTRLTVTDILEGVQGKK